MRSVLLIVTLSFGLALGLACEKKNSAPSGGRSSKIPDEGEELDRCMLEKAGEIAAELVDGEDDDSCETIHPDDGEKDGDGEDDGDLDHLEVEDPAKDPKTLELAIEPPMLKTCKGLGKAYIRETLRCHDKIDVSETCNEAWVEEALGADGLAALDEFKADGYVLDQCGMAGDEIIVLMYCTAAVEGGPCVPKEELTSSVSIKTACFQTFERAGDDCKYDDL